MDDTLPTMRVLSIILCIAASGLPVLAQEKPTAGEVMVYLGGGHVGGQEGTYGKGVEQGASLEVRPFKNIGFMADVHRLNHSGSISNVNGSGNLWDISGTAVQVSGSAVYHFEIPLEPYVFAGAGGLRNSRDINVKTFFVLPSNILSNQPNIGSATIDTITVKKTDPEVHVGAGIRIPIAWHFSFRPEIRFVRTANLSLVHGVFGLAYAW